MFNKKQIEKLKEEVTSLKEEISEIKQAIGLKYKKTSGGSWYIEIPISKIQDIEEYLGIEYKEETLTTKGYKKIK